MFLEQKASMEELLEASDRCFWRWREGEEGREWRGGRGRMEGRTEEGREGRRGGRRGGKRPFSIAQRSVMECNHCGCDQHGCVTTCWRLRPDEDRRFPVAKKYSICRPTSGAMDSTLLMTFAGKGGGGGVGCGFLGGGGGGGGGRAVARRPAPKATLPLLPSNLSGEILPLRSSSERTKRRKLSSLSLRTMR